MIRVLHVIGAMNRAGAETFLMNVYRVIDRTKIQFDFLVLTEEEADYNAEICELGGHIYSVPWFTGLNRGQFRRAVSTFFDEHPEHPIVHGHIGSSAAIYLDEANKHGRYTIAHSHSTKGPFSFAQLAYQVLAYPTRNVADFFMACSPEAGLVRFGKRVVQDKSRYAVVNNGIDLAHFVNRDHTIEEAKAALGLEGAYVFGHTGRFVEVKNHAFLIDVFAHIKALEPRACLLLVGDGVLRNSAERKVAELGLKDAVFFVGLVSDTKPYLDAMDVFVFPSLFEGLSLALIEAQAAGLPCVVSNTISDSGFVTDYVTALSLHEPVTQWAQYCIEAVSQRALAREGGASQVKAHGYDTRDTAQWLTRFYESHAG